MAPTVLGMDLLTFILAVFSAIGALFSILNYVRQIVPTAKFLALVDNLIETRTLWKEFEQQSNLSDKQMDQFFDIMDSLEDDAESFIFIAAPTCNLVTIFRAWLSTWSLIRLGQDVDKLRIGLLTLNSQRSVIDRSRERMGKPDAPFVDFTSLETRYVATADAFIASFGGRKPKRPFAGDVESDGMQLRSEFMLDNGPPSAPAPRVENGRRRKIDHIPFRRARRPISTRSSITVNSSQDTLVVPEPLITSEGNHPHNRYPPIGVSSSYLGPKSD